MLAAELWLLYAIPAYVLWTVVFWVRYGFWPWAEGFPPRTVYGWMDAGLAAALLAYTAWVVFGPWPGLPLRAWMIAGVLAWAMGVGLRWWAIAALGRNWRIGQDERDERAEFVATGPYRIMHHPINAGLILVAIGQALVTGLDVGALGLLAYAVVYFVVQGRAEERRWRRGT